MANSPSHWTPELDSIMAALALKEVDDAIFFLLKTCSKQRVCVESALTSLFLPPFFFFLKLISIVLQSGNRASACSSYSRRVAHLNLISSVSFEISPSIKAQQTEVGGVTRRAPLGRAAPGPPEPQGSPRLSEREMEKNRAVHAL